MLGNEQRPHAVPKSPSLEEIVAEKIAREAIRIAEERIRDMFMVTEFDPDEVHGFMGSEEAAEFLGLPYSSFREMRNPKTAAVQIFRSRDRLADVEDDRARSSVAVRRCRQRPWRLTVSTSRRGSWHGDAPERNDPSTVL